MDREDMMSTDTGEDQQHDRFLKLHHTLIFPEGMEAGVQ